MEKNQQKISLEMTKKQFQEMLLAAMLYSWIRGGLADRQGEDFGEYEELEHFLLTLAKKNGLSDLVEDFRGGLIPTDSFSKLQENIIEEYDDDVFWHELITRLGQRDFSRTITVAEKHALKKEKWLPERISTLYKNYEEEFETYGLDRVRIENHESFLQRPGTYPEIAPPANTSPR